MLDRGSGLRVRDLEGGSTSDFFGGILTISVGHCNERVNRALQAQMDRLGHVSTLYPSLPMVELAEKTGADHPGTPPEILLYRFRHRSRRVGDHPRPGVHGALEILVLRHGIRDVQCWPSR